MSPPSIVLEYLNLKYRFGVYHPINMRVIRAKVGVKMLLDKFRLYEDIIRTQGVT